MPEGMIGGSGGRAVENGNLYHIFMFACVATFVLDTQQYLGMLLNPHNLLETMFSRRGCGQPRCFIISS